MPKNIYLIALFMSTVLYSASLVDISGSFYLVMPALALLLIVILKNSIKDNCFWVSVVWLPVVVFTHYCWVFELVIDKLVASVEWATIIYSAISVVHLLCFIVFIVIASSAFNFLIKFIPLRPYQAVFFIIIFGLSFQVAGSMLMLILDEQGCYNLMSPVIPLSKFFTPNKAVFDRNLEKNANKECFKINNTEISFLKIKQSASHNRDLWSSGQQLFHALQQAGPKQIVVTPESFISCPLNREPEFLSFVQRAIGPHQLLMLAGQYEGDDGRLFQAVYAVAHDGVRYVYLKQHAVPCVERMPRYLRNLRQVCTVFKAEQTFSSADHMPIQLAGFDFEGVRIVPRVCSDFFLMTSITDLTTLKKMYGEKVVVVVHVNDTWFVSYMQDLLKQVARMRAWFANINLVFVGYED